MSYYSIERPVVKSKFITALLASFEFPVALRAGLVATYKERYTTSLVRNRWFGDLVVPLVTAAHPNDIDASVIYSGNPAALSALLDKTNLDNNALITIVKLWYLSADDQWRLVNRYLPSGTTQILSSMPDLFREARGRLDGGQHRTRRQDKYRGAPAVSSLREHPDHIGVPGSYMHGPEHHAGRLSLSVAHLGDTSRFGLSAFELEINPVLGDGKDADSRLAWRTFLSLIESDPDVPLGSVLDVVHCLTYAAN